MSKISAKRLKEVSFKKESAERDPSILKKRLCSGPKSLSFC